MSQTVLARCTCGHPQQDAWYGRGVRVHNEGKDGKGRCSVCSTEKADLFKPHPSNAVRSVL